MSPEILHEAAEWLVRLDDQPTGRDREAFRVWLSQDSEHLEAFQRMQETLVPLQGVKQQRLASPVLKALAVVAVTALVLVLALGL
ncbi:FecR/PupR family sigma factor regulator [Pseudomonas putida]|uniref:DUF4880 domain-containing protein n=1 Tax=Pseudomonas putida TaxID=303 RepID=A0A1Y3KKF8_PSEPU|nr:FecR/PupR family sigma factor regulator [Pseudomonas putida]OUM26347.1 DUF4880 domain-containing protein [Pseudomonas putida]